jgi:hypothetical protein
MRTNAPAIVPAPTWPVDDDHRVAVHTGARIAQLHECDPPFYWDGWSDPWSMIDGWSPDAFEARA